MEFEPASKQCDKQFLAEASSQSHNLIFQTCSMSILVGCGLIFLALSPLCKFKVHLAPKYFLR